MIVLLLSLFGLFSGYAVTRLSIDECRGKDRIIALLISPFIILLVFNFSILVNTLLLFIIAHLGSSLAYLRRTS